MAEIREVYAHLDRLTLHTRQAGSGRPIVLLHGISANAAVWDPVIASLAVDGHVIAVSQRGHGLSDAPKADPEAYTGNQYAQDIIELIEQTSAGKALIVGHSLGSRNGIKIARMRPDLIDGLVAIDFTPYIETPVLDRLAERVEGGNQTFNNLEAIKKYLRTRYPKLPEDAISRRAVHGYHKKNQDLFPLADADALRATITGLRESLVEDVQELEVPTVFIRGESSTLVSEEAFVSTISLRPDLQYTVVPGADHYVPEEQPAAVVAITRMMNLRSSDYVAANET